MRQLTVALRFLRSILLVATSLSATLLAPGVAGARSPSSSDLLGIYNSLPADQQRAILQQVGDPGGTADREVAPVFETEG